MLDDTKEEKTIKLLETAVLLMEGASEEDIKLINSGRHFFDNLAEFLVRNSVSMFVLYFILRNWAGHFH